VRLRVWGPLPPSPSGIADYLFEQLGALRRHCDVSVVLDDPAQSASADALDLRWARPEDGDALDGDALDFYQLGNSPAHAYVYRAALHRPGVVLLHDLGLHHLVLHETVERGDLGAYLREMRRAHGERGSFMGRQIARALGGELWPARFPLHDRVLESALAVVGLSRAVTTAVAPRLPGRPVLHLPHHLALPLDPFPGRAEARAALGLPADAALVVAPGLATRAKRLDAAARVVARLRAGRPELRLVIAGAVEPGLPLADWAAASGLADALVVTGRLDLPDFVRHLVAADVVLALRHPSHGEMSGALVRALGVGRPVLVTAGSAAAEEFPDGVVARVEPGVLEAAQLEALLARLLDDDGLRERLGRVAGAHARREHDLAATAERLAGFLRDVHARRDELRARVVLYRPADGSLQGFLRDELRWSAQDLGLSGLDLGLDPLLAELAGGRA
jgi:glycosyltransferase involved in cell wall biosynthesis